MRFVFVSDFGFRNSDLHRERLGYFAPWPADLSAEVSTKAEARRRRLDPDAKPGKLVFNRTITLKDSWAKIEKKQDG